MSKRDTLAAIDFGQRVAEEEGEALAAYFVETDNWRRVFAGDIDVIYGPKGSGKSALYSLLIARTNELFDRNVILVPAENPRGRPAFRDLITDPPATEAEFINLWKLYFLSLLASCFDEYGIGGKHADHLREILTREGLAKTPRTLQGRVQDAFEYVKRLLRPSAVEGGMAIDPATQLPTGFTSKIIFNEPTEAARATGVESVDELFHVANEALKDNS